MGLSRPAADGPLEQKPKAKEVKAQRPAGMSREAYALLGDLHPITPTALANELKKSDDKGLAEKRKQGPVVWRYRKFYNAARTDGLHLRHWVKASKASLIINSKGSEKEVLDDKYKFAECNKQIMVYRYDDEEWSSFVEPLDSRWSRKETDYLLDLVAQFDSRFLPVADRYQFPGGVKRGIEDLKARYYCLSRALLIGRAGGTDLIANEWLIKHPFDAERELLRKAALEALLQRRKEEDAIEEGILESARAIELRRKAEALARRPPPPAATAPVDYSATSRFTEDPGHGVCSLFDADACPAVLPGGLYLRSSHTMSVAAEQIRRLAGNPRVQKMAESLLENLKLLTPPAMSTRATCGTWLAVRAEALSSVDPTRRVAPQPAATPADTSAGAPAWQHASTSWQNGGAGVHAQDQKPPVGLVGAGASRSLLPARSSSRAATPEASTSMADVESGSGAGRAKRPKTKASVELAGASGTTPRSDKRARSARKYIDE